MIPTAGEGASDLGQGHSHEHAVGDCGGGHHLPQEDGEYHDNENDDNDDDDDEEYDEDDGDSLCYGQPHHHSHHIHHDQHDQHHSFHPYHHQHLPHHGPLSFFDHMDGYISDDLDMSDGTGDGAPLVNYLDVTSLLTSDMDMDISDDSGTGDSVFGDDVGIPHGTNAPGNNALPSPPGVLLPATLSFTPVPVAFDDQLSNTMVVPPIVGSNIMLTQLEQLAEADNDGAVAAWFEGAHPVPLTNPNPHTLGPNNYRLTDFLHQWARQSRLLPGMSRERGRYPWPSRISDMASKPLDHVQYGDLEGDQCDLQGIDWEDLGVTRKEARERRLLTYNNYTNNPNSDRWTPNLPDVDLPRRESYFRFRRMDIRRNIHLTHFQLRNVLGTTSRTRAFYPGLNAVYQFNPISGKSQSIMRLSYGPGSKVTAMAAEHGVLVAGTFGGEYLLRHIDSGEPEETACQEGIITKNSSGITNHLQVHQARTSSAPVAAFASNDMLFRVLDITTEKWLSQSAFDFPLNCTALSPDRRLRVMVGDHYNVFIAAAESTLPAGNPEILQELSSHRDFGFACAWADDGWTVATGFQDKAIKIWDARRWTDSSGYATPVCTLRADMAGVRSLRFSPVGSGKRVLVAAEEADFVNIIDAQSFRSKQTVDIFGEIGGISFTNDGQDLAVLCCDRTRGGLVQLERCGAGQETSWNLDEDSFSARDYRWCRGASFDWQPSYFTREKHTKVTLSRRRRRGAALDTLEPF
ncbi:WD40-repeat-containing domain protein [Lasiosphaeria miniovina]|uniref:WD40-repeat-containing domain protein n=1 Tax=Lasiosphaeria miniovina TaxID=1954250 RepID=A0AA40DHJ1_9PEZI|nr:WD40-repeat-containing domain protein [Lasiosphaeria miniovina]KAK0703789.1 WD40-repeat-containing domain protein [Lasiosphaeria miniovina]